MKKLVIFSVFLMVFGVFGGAIAKDCKLQSCDVTSPLSGWVRAHYPDGNQCYYCGGVTSDNCSNGTNIAVVDGLGIIKNIYECDTLGITVNWKINNPGVFCADKYTDLRASKLADLNLANAILYYSLDGGVKTTGYASGDATVLKAGNIACIVVKCNDGFAPNANKTACVEKGRGECESRPHMKWESGKCVCREAGKTESADKKRCVNEADECKKKSAAGYIWDGSNCVCPKGKVENSAKNQCVNPPRQVPQDEANCKKLKNFGMGVRWNNSNRKCECENGFDLELDVDKNIGICEDPDKNQMDRCRAAGESVATWDATNKKCVCKDSANMVWNGTNCVKTAEAEAAEQAQQQLLLQQQQQQQQQQMNAATNRINNAVLKMSELQQSFGVSAWKTAEGKFNTSRLISDSVAGVVLGTAGGLITSNIIKKNQIRGGFEDLSCTVGGQVVAEWGDDFSVGIR